MKRKTSISCIAPSARETAGRRLWAAAMTLLAALLTATTAWATTTSTITVDGTDYTLFTGFTATGGTTVVAAAFNCSNMVDGDLSSSWHLNGEAQPYYIEFNSDDPIIPKGYIFNTYNASSFKPTGWVLKAKANTSDSWTTLSSKSGSLPSGQEFQYACDNNGNSAYKYFRFEVSNSNNNIWLTEIRLYGNVYVYYTHLTQKAATCTETGIKQDCYQRNDGKYFTDETGATEIPESEVIDPMIPHTGDHHEATDTNIEYWQCSVCGKYFSDEACTTEITEEQTKIYSAIIYLDATGAQQSCTNYTTVESNSTDWNNAWYVVSSNTTIADRITVSGTVNLILVDGATLTASKGITVGSSATFNVYAQSDDEATMGALVADATNDNVQYNAGIGGVENADAGTITINGGKINAIGFVGAGIGSGGGTSTVGTITITGGIVTAHDSQSYGAGIGGGFSGGKAGTISLSGGIINAAGIGSGNMGGDCSMTVNISDGIRKIVATPVQGGACIGKGKSASGSVTVNFISGGNIVTSDAKDAVFYDSGEGTERQIRAKALNHTVTMSDDLKANITVNTEYAFAGETVTLTLGAAVDASTLKVNDGTSDLTLTDAGNRQYTFTMPVGNVTVTATLLQTYAVNLPASMEVVSATNAADANGKYISGTTITFKASFPYAASNVSDGTNTLEPDADGVYSVTIGTGDITVTATVGRSSTIDLTDASGDFTAINNDVLTGTTSHTVTIANGAKITLSGTTISGGIVCEGTAEITLVGTNNVSNTWYSSAGIQIGASGTKLTIKGDGSLSATGGSAAAGIGLGRTWGDDATGGSIVIEGGTVTTSGGNGIGTGTVGNSKNATVGDIIIKGGTVSARLGSGDIYNGSSVEIGAIKIYDTIDKVDASAITKSVTYMHVENETETDVTASASTYFTIIEDGDRRVIAPKDDTDYTITIANDIEHGSIACAAETAKFGEKITITATPDFGYRLSHFVVKDANNNDVATTGNSFFMPKGNVTVSAVFEQGTHGTTEFVWGYWGDDGFVTEATIYDGLTTVNCQEDQSYNILNNMDDQTAFLLDNDTYYATIPYSGGTGTFLGYNGTSFNINNVETGFYDITMTDVGNGKWSVSILKTVGKMDDIPDQTYTGSEITPEPLVLAGSLNLTKGTDYEYSYTNNTNVGTATVTVTFMGDYSSFGSVDKEFTITKATPAVTAPTAIADLVYTGSSQALVTAGTTDFGSLLYSTDGSTYSAGIPTGTDAGTYTVYYKVEGSDNWNAVEPQTVEVTIGYYSLSLADKDNNAEAISNVTINYGGKADVTLTDRWLFKDGSWNTLCLPFEVSAAQMAESSHPLHGATVKELDTTGKYTAGGVLDNEDGTLQTGFKADDGTLYLYFKEATAIEAGRPYIVKWDKPEGYDGHEGDYDISSPVFSGITIDNSAEANARMTVTAQNSGLNSVEFIGTYSPVAIAKDDKSRLFLSADNTLYYPDEDSYQTGTFRAYFHVDLTGSAGVRACVMNFGDGEATGIREIDNLTIDDLRFAAAGWYDLHGRKLSGRPSVPGIYVNNGRVVVIK